MARPKNWPPVVHQHRGEDRIWYGGKWVSLGPAGSEKSKREYARILAEAASGGTVPRLADEYLVSQLARDWLSTVNGVYHPRYEGRLFRAADLLTDVYGETRAAAFGPAALEAWQLWLADKKLSRRYVNQLVGAVRMMFRWAVRKEKIPSEKAAALATVPGLRRGRTSARETEEIPPARDADVEAAVAHMRPIVADMVRLQRLTGMRPGEVCGLRPCEVVREGLLKLPGGGAIDLGGLGVWVYSPEQHKNKWRGKSRLIVLGPKAQAVLLPYMGRPAESHCFSPKESVAALRAEQQAGRRARGGGSGGNRKPRKDDPDRAARDHYDAYSYRSAVRRACGRAKVAVWKPNQLRHAAGTAVQAAAGLDAARAYLGHDDPKTTTIYAARDFATAAEVARKMG